MNKKELIEKRRYLRKENCKYQSGVFVEIPPEQWPQMNAPLFKVLRSREFLVQIFQGYPTRLSICRTEINDAGQWKDGITWDELQAIKNACGYADRDAVEAYPKQQDMVYVSNMRHLWIVGEDYTQFFWRGGKGSGFKSGQVAEEIEISGKLDT